MFCCDAKYFDVNVDLIAVILREEQQSYCTWRFLRTKVDYPTSCGLRGKNENVSYPRHILKFFIGPATSCICQGESPNNHRDVTLCLVSALLTNGWDVTSLLLSCFAL